MLTIAICPDDYSAKQDQSDSFSKHWEEVIVERGHAVRHVDVKNSDILQQIKGCNGFMWRWTHLEEIRQIASRLLPIVQNHLGIPVFPNQNTCWHYDDRIAQAYLFQALEIASPETNVFFDQDLALNWAKTARYPQVLKLFSGAGSANVAKIENYRRAEEYIHLLFNAGCVNLVDRRQELIKRGSSWLKTLAGIAYLRRLPPSVHKGYILFQEFLPDNSFDTQVTVIGDRAFAFRRLNAAEDSQASGSRQIDYDSAQIDLNFVKLAFSVARKLESQSIAINGLYDRQKDSVVTSKASYTYISETIHKCPGHWKLQPDEELIWTEENIWPGQAQANDFLDYLLALEHEK